jgi:hypothetical protein
MSEQPEPAKSKDYAMATPPDWESFVNVSEDGLAVISDADERLWVVTADDPDQTGEYYRVWMIPPTVVQLPSNEVKEVAYEPPLLMSNALRAISDLLSDFPSDPGPADVDSDDDEDDDDED